jgi:hypothetical protein
MRTAHTARRRRRYLVGGVLIGGLTSALVAMQGTALKADEWCIAQNGTCYDESCYKSSNNGVVFHCGINPAHECTCSS